MREPIGEYNDTFIVRTHALESMRCIIQRPFKNLMAVLSSPLSPIIEIRSKFEIYRNYENFSNPMKKIVEFVGLEP